MQFCFQLSLAEGDNVYCWPGPTEHTVTSCLKRLSVNCLIHFYKRCVSKPCQVQAAFLQDQWGFTNCNKTTSSSSISCASIGSSLSSMHFWKVPRNGSFGLYLFSFCDFGLKSWEGEEIEGKSGISSHISKMHFSKVPRKGSFWLYLFSFCDFWLKTWEGEEIEGKSGNTSHISKMHFPKVPRKDSFGLYLFSFCDFGLKISEGEEIVGKSGISSHIS